MTSLTNQQKQAVETIDRHVLVCAGAGSGKTHVLIERFIEILKKNETVAVSQLVAVTFTRKAATEMRNRLKSKLKALVESDEGNRERWQVCLGEVDGARIGTIHSLCEFIIKSFPVEAGIDPQFEVIDELKQAELLSASIDQAFREVIAGAAIEQTLFEDFDLDIVRHLVLQGIQGSSRFFESLRNFPLSDDEALNRHMEFHIARARRVCLSQLVSSLEWQQLVPQIAEATLPSGSKLEAFRKEFMQCADEVEASFGLKSADSDDVQGAIKSAWAALSTIASQTPRTTGGVDGKPLRDLMKGVREVCKSYAERISVDLGASDAAALRCITALVALIQRTVDLYEEQKRTGLLLDFNDLIGLAFTALKTENSAALRHFNENTHTLLVDEFQDTNTVQSDLLALVAGERAKFFLIGDDKQSIYRFQGADVSTFNKWRQRFSGSNESLTLSLSESFRSHPELVAFVNIVFSSLMVDQGDAETHRAVFERLKAARKDGDKGRIELLVSQPDFERAATDPDASRRLEAEGVVEWISQKIQQQVKIFDKHQGVVRGAEPGDFAVLVPRNGDFAYFERAMTDRSMSYVVVSGKGYLERQEILDMENLLRFLSSPRDDHSLLAALRSPMFAVSDDLIHKIAVDAGTHHTDSLWRKVRTFAGQGDAAAGPLVRTTEVLEKFLLQSNLLPLAELVRTIIIETHYDLILLGLPNGLQRSRNLWKLVSVAADKEHCSCGEFAELLSNMRTVGVKLADAPTDDSNAVKLMTIHASKGLEFPFVALPVLSARNAMKKDRLLFHKDYGLAFNTARTDEDVVPTWLQACKVLDEDMELAEKKRLFYVAMTRARDYLGLFFQADGTERNSFRSWLLDALQIEPDDLYAAEDFVKSVRVGDDVADVFVRQWAGTSLPYSSSGTKADEIASLAEFESIESRDALDAGLILQSELERANEQEAIHLLAKLGQASSCASSLDATDEDEGEGDNEAFGSSLPAISDVQAGVAVVTDECGQMKLLFAQEASTVAHLEGPEHNSLQSTAGRGVAESLSRLPDALIETGTNCDSIQWTLDLLPPMNQEKLPLPSSWQGCERVTASDGRPVFSATLLGTFFHSLMENIPSDGRRLSEDEIEAIAFAQSAVIPLPGNLSALVNHGEALLDKFYNSGFAAIFLGASRRLHELPYLYSAADGVVHARRPDLILQQSSGSWLLVDYKTDHFEKHELLKHSLEHGQQLQTYVNELQELLGVQLTAFIYYAEYGLLQECPPVS
ncbi:MAG TPA: UvrD-helicase domain-containing protein [Oculatellaceae cyanobacterium]